MKIDSLDVIGGTNTPMDLAQYSIYFYCLLLLFHEMHSEDSYRYDDMHLHNLG